MPPDDLQKLVEFFFGVVEVRVATDPAEEAAAIDPLGSKFELSFSIPGNSEEHDARSLGGMQRRPDVNAQSDQGVQQVLSQLVYSPFDERPTDIVQQIDPGQRSDDADKIGYATLESAGTVVKLAMAYVPLVDVRC